MKQNRHCQRAYFALNAMANTPPQSVHDRLDVDKKCTNVFLNGTGF